MPAPYDVGEVVKLSATLTNPDSNAPFDPVSVTFMFCRPNSTLWFTVSSVRDDTGKWHAEQEVDVPGDWWGRVETTGPDGARERMFTVNATRFPGA
jgi:hypothetical protein